MSGSGRIKTKYTGVYYRLDAKGKQRTFYIMYRQGGRQAKLIEEPVGKSSSGMTEAKASQIRADRMRGKEQSNVEKRKAQEATKRDYSNRWTIDKIWEVYQEAHPEHKSRKRDISRYNTHIRHRFGNKTPDEMITNDIDILKSECMNSGKSKGTIQRIISQLRAIINFGIKRGLCQPLIPSRLCIESIHVDTHSEEMLDREQMNRLIQAINQEDDKDAAALMKLALYTGMRKGALLALRWDDCDFIKKIITLRGEVAKNGRTSFIPMNEAARLVLENIKRTDSPFVFPGRNGKQRTDYRRIARRVKKNAGLPDSFRPLHGLRHNFASQLASTGKIDMYSLQKLLTHANSQSTQRYAHLADEALRRSANLADDIFLDHEISSVENNDEDNKNESK